MPRQRMTTAAVGVGLLLVAAACGSSSSSSGATTAAPGTTAGSATTAATETTAAPAGTTINFRPLDTGGPLTVAALDKGDIQMALLFSSDGTITEKGWVTLNDDKKLQPVDNLIVVGKKDKLSSDVAGVLNGALSQLTTDDLQALNVKLNVDKQDPKAVAKDWLTSKNLLTTDPKLSGSIVIGSANFNEQELVAEMVSQLLESHGMSVTRKFKLGAREVVAPALEKGDIDAYVEYVGSYLTFLKGTPSSDLDATVKDLRAVLDPKGLTALEPTPAQDQNAFVVTKATADKFGLANISDLSKVTGSFTLGGPPECPQRPYCILGLEKTYGLKFNV